MSGAALGARFRADLARAASRWSVAAGRQQDADANWLSDAEEAQRSAQQRSAADASRARVDTQSARDAESRAASESLRRHAATLAPGALSATVSDLTHASLDVPGDHVRIGSYAGAPVLVPWIGRSSIMIDGDSRKAHMLAETLAARVIAAVAPSSLRVTVFDPTVQGLLGAFGELRRHAPTSFTRPILDDDRLRQELDRVLGGMAETAERLRQSFARDVIEIFDGAKVKPILDLLVIDDSDSTIEPRTRALLDRILERGPALGVVVLLIQADGDGAALPGELRRITVASDGTASMDVDGDILHFDAETGRVDEIAQRLVTEVTERLSASDGPMVGAHRLRPAGDLWSASSETGIEVVIGERSDATPLTIAFRSENPPMPNALLGGAVGQGKSNLLLTIIYAVAAKYSPEEVELMLLDFKEGLEFQRFADESAWLPHATVIGLESDREFGVRLLEWVRDEMQRRAEVFKAAGTSGYDAYRRAGHTLPRLMLFVDEFQVLLGGDDEIARKAAELLTHLARTGRAYGLHLVLSSQTLSGLRSLATRADAIFAQFPLRLALRNTASESQTILSHGNTAASSLRFRGEVIVNRNAGEDGDEFNERGIATYADGTAVRTLQRELWSKSNAPSRPRVFKGRDFADWPATWTARARVLPLGIALDPEGTVVEHRFDDEPAQAIAVVGGDRAVCTAVTRAALTAATLPDSGYAEVVAIGADELGTWCERRRRSLQIPLRHVRYDDVDGWLDARGEQTAATLVVIEDSQRIARLHDEPATDADNPFVTPPTLAQRLATLVGSGSAEGLDVMIHASGLHALERILGLRHDAVKTFVLGGVSLQELRQVAGFDAELSEASPRARIVGTGRAHGGVSVVPLSPEVISR